MILPYETPSSPPICMMPLLTFTCAITIISSSIISSEIIYFLICLKRYPVLKKLFQAIRKKLFEDRYIAEKVYEKNVRYMQYQ